MSEMGGTPQDASRSRWPCDGRRERDRAGRLRPARPRGARLAIVDLDPERVEGVVKRSRPRARGWGWP
jgi:hypothetical protein